MEITIEHMDYQDFLQSLGAGCADLVLTDPPYAISRKTGFVHTKKWGPRFHVSTEFGDWDKAEIDLDALCRHTYNALRTGGTAIIWYDLWKVTALKDKMERAGFRMIRQILWQKTNPVPLNSKRTYLSNSREMALVGVKDGKPTFNSEHDIGVYRHGIPTGAKRIHPTQKPLPLFRELIEKHTNEGDFVVDPFLGSGTTALACAQTGRQFAGCDADTGYVSTAKQALAETLTEQRNLL